jgi:hypothetical protein
VPIVVGEGGFWSAGDEVPATDGSGRVIGSLQPSEEVQAAYVGKLYARARDAGAAATIWFTLDDYESLPTKYGIYASSGAPKAAQPAYRWAAAALGDARTLLLEDLTLLLSNLMLSEPDGAEARAIAQAEAVLALEAHVILVSNEVGMGLVPASPLGRRFRDALGRVNQATAAACGEVYLLVAGLPLRLK